MFVVFRWLIAVYTLFVHVRFFHVRPLRVLRALKILLLSFVFITQKTLRVLRALTILFLVGGAVAQEIEITAKQVLLVDGATGTVLFAKNPDEVFDPASMTKLFTAETVFHSLSKEEISMESLFKISEQTWRRGGAPSRTTTMFASVNSFVRVEDLLRGLTVLQANDAALALVEGIEGNEADFVKRMNERTAELGLTQTQIFNVTGLTQEKGEGEGATKDTTNRTTVRDLMIVARHIEKKYPHYFSLYGEEAFEWNKIFQRNRHPLYHAEMGVDGFVSGGTQTQGYGLVATAKQGKRRLFLVLAGVEKEKNRLPEAKKLIEWGMKEFESKLVYDADEEVAMAHIYGGIESHVALKTLKPIGILLPKGKTPRLKIRALYEGPLSAPVDKGKTVGQLVISSAEGIWLEAPLVTATRIEEAGLIQKASDALFEISIGWMRKYLTL